MSARRTLGSQAGETLVEVMMTVAIVGMAMVAVLGALSASMRLSSTHRASADTGAALVAAAEAVKTYDPAWAFCGFNLKATYQSALTAIAADWPGTDLEVTSATCPLQNGVQKAYVRVTATASDGTSVYVDVVRRSVS